MITVSIEAVSEVIDCMLKAGNGDDDGSAKLVNGTIHWWVARLWKSHPAVDLHGPAAEGRA
jgi:hypothetical protein